MVRLRVIIGAIGRLGCGRGLERRSRIDGAVWELLYSRGRVYCLPDITHRDGSSLRSDTMLVNVGAEAMKERSDHQGPPHGLTRGGHWYFAKVHFMVYWQDYQPKPWTIRALPHPRRTMRNDSRY